MISQATRVRLAVDDAMNRRTALYLLYAADDALLYVGVGFNPQVRWLHHAREKAWWAEVARKELVWYDTRAMALEAEAEAISNLSPRYNVHGAPRQPLPVLPPAVQVTGFRDLAELLRRQIAAGDYPTGQRLPSEPDLMEVFGLARATARRAVRELRDQGLAEYVPGWGTVVREPREVEAIRLEPGWRLTARPATPKERECYGDGVAMLQVYYPDGSGDAYPGDRTEFLS